MNRNEFFEEVMKEVKAKIPESEGIEVSLNTVVKINDQQLHGLTICKSKNGPAPTIYLDDAYEAHQAGVSIDEIAGDIANIYMETKDKEASPPEEMLDFDNADDKLTIRVMEHSRNKLFLENIPYMSLGNGYVAICDISMDDGQQGAWRAKVTSELMESMGFTRAEMFEKAMENAARIDPPVITDMESSMVGLDGENLAQRDEPITGEKASAYLVTNQMGRLGAATLFYPGIQEQISKVLDDSYYVLPSSIHEFIIIPESHEQDARDLQNMVITANNAVVAPEDVLSNKVLRYDKDSKRLEVPEELREQEKTEREER